MTVAHSKTRQHRTSGRNDEKMVTRHREEGEEGVGGREGRGRSCEAGKLVGLGFRVRSLLAAASSEQKKSELMGILFSLFVTCCISFLVACFLTVVVC